MTEKIELKPEDVDFVPKEVAYWREIIESVENDIERQEKLLKFNKSILEMANNKKKEAEDNEKADSS